MKQIVFLVMLVMLALTVSGCEELNRTPEQREEARRVEQMERVGMAMSRLVYFQDMRPDPPICYAYFWEGASQGGPAFTQVECERVEHLLLGRVSALGE